MLKKITAYLITGIGFIGIGYFKFYKGTLIPMPWLWFVVSVAVFAIGFFMIPSVKKPGQSKQEKYDRDRLKRLKESGEKILLTTENCELKENNYYEETDNGSSWRVQALDAAYDPDRNYAQHFVKQAAIIYYYETGDGEKIRMTSNIFPMDADGLKRMIGNKEIYLYVNRFHKTDYEFVTITDN